MTMLLPDWLMALVAIDRVLAVEKGIWYSKNCTVKAAWIPILAVFAILAVFGAPRIVFGRLQPEIPLCSSSNLFYLEVLTFAGLPALVIVASMTVRLLYAIKNKRQTAQRPNDRKV